MKKVYTYILWAAAILAAGACNMELQVEDPMLNGDPIYETLSVKVGAETKVTLETDAAKSSFENGDKIAVWTGAGSFQTCTVDGGNISVNISGGARSNYAVYYNGATLPTYSAGTLSITLPATYAYADVAGTKNPVPMVAKNVAGESGDMTFYSVGTLFRVTVKAIPSDATGLVFQFPGNKVNGTFTVTNPGTSTPSVATSAPGSGEDKVTVTFAAGTATEMTLNIPLPTGAYEDVYITPVGSETKVASARHIAAGGYTAARAHGKKLTATLVSFTINDSGDKVIFAPGNLEAMVSIPGTYTPIRVYINETYPDYEIKGTVFSATSWKFADNQFDYDSNSQLDGENTICDHFSWVGSGVTNETVQNSYGLYTANSWRVLGAIGESESLYHDWGELPIESYASGFWRTPTGNENGDWDYILSSRSGSRFARGKINGISGLFIFPDTYSHPSDLNPFNNINNKRADFSSNQFTSSEWERIESAGVIFLPAAGLRSDNNEEATTISGAGSVGSYWSSTAYNNGYSRYLRFTEADTYPDSWYYRQEGRSVRLVRDLN